MKLRFIAATLAVMAMGNDLYYGGRFAGDTQHTNSYCRFTKDSASILPEQYKSYATTMNTGG